jgi:hypothetical protein
MCIRDDGRTPNRVYHACVSEQKGKENEMGSPRGDDAIRGDYQLSRHMYALSLAR